MQDEDKTKEQLIDELADMRQQIVRWEALEAESNRMGAALRDSEENYRRIFDLSPIGIATLDMKGVITSCNPAVEKEGGYSEGELVGRHFSKIAPLRARDIPKYARLFASILRGKTPKPFEVEYNRVDGTPGWTEVQTAFLERDGRKLGVLVLQRDITERKQAEERIRREQEFSSNLLQGLKEGFAAVDQEGGKILVNRELCQMTGWSEQELLGQKPPFEYWAEEGLEDISDAFEKTLIGVEGEYELIFKRKDGERFIALVSPRITTDPHGNTVFFATIKDISERKRAEAEVRERSERLAALHEVSQAVSQSLDLEAVAAVALEAALKVLDLDAGIIRYLNEATQELPLLCDRGLPTEMVKERQDRPPLKVGEGLAGVVAQLEEPLVVQDFSHDTRSIYESSRRSGFESYVGVPLKVKDRVVGIMSAVSSRRRTFTPAELAMMGSLGNMVGMAIANARLFEEQKRHTEELSALHQVGQAVSQTLDLEAVAAQALEAALAVLGLDAGIIRYVDEATQYLPILNERGFSVEAARLLHRDLSRLKLGQGLAGTAAQEGKLLVVEDLSQDPRFLAPFMIEAGFHCAAYVPLKVRDTVVGVVTAFSRRQRTFIPAELAMMASIGNMVGMAIANARLFEQVEAASREWGQTFSAMSDGVAIVSPDFRIIRANQALAGMLDTTPEALVGRHCYEAIHGAEQPIEGCPTARCLAEKRACDMEWQEPHLGGRWLHLRADPVLGPQGEVLSVVQSITDITEGKRAEEALRESEIKYRGIFDESVAAIYVFDTEKHFIDTNQAGLDLLGYSREELLAMSIPDVDADPVVVLPAHEQLLSGERIINYEHQLKRKDGSIITVLNNSRPLSDAHGNVIGMQSTLVDITERKRAEEDIRQLNEELESMIFLISHDLRAPIISIQGLISGMTQDHAQALGDEGALYLERIVKNTQQLESLIGELLELSSVGRGEETREMMDTGELVVSVAEGLGPQIQEVGAEVVIAEGMPQVFCDGRRLRQVFVNLIDNAVRFTGDQGHPRIEVGYEEGGESWHFWVRDNGMGIAAEDQEKVFSAFQTLGWVRGREGSGVGLAIVKKVAENHGGQVWVESEGQGQGSTFHFTIAKPRQEGV